jgi:Spherulation-specific family 4
MDTLRKLCLGIAFLSAACAAGDDQGGITAGAAGTDGVVTGGAAGTGGITAGAAGTDGVVTGGAGGVAGTGGVAGFSDTGGSGGTAGSGGSGGAAGAPGTGATGGSAGSSGAGGAGGKGGKIDAGTGATAGAGVDAGDSGAAAAGTIVPLYTYPTDASWTAIVTAKQAHPTVRVVAIVNPNNGPGSSKDGSYTTGIGKLVAANIVVIGYVATGYTSRTAATVEADIDRWKSFYPQLQGIFFDEQSNKAADVAYYQTVSDYAKGQGLSYTVGNPGTDTAEAFVGALDTMLIYESAGLPSNTELAGWHTKYAPSNFGIIPYATGFDAAFVQTARKYVAYIYLQNDDLPNPWDTLPSYFGNLLAALE